jgi:hypothetical protein
LVRRLRVGAPSDALARRGIILLEDALNTASLPACSGSQMVMIRRLPLGRIRPDAVSSQVALLIERRLRELASGAMHAADPSAGDAPAVYFRDDAEAHVALAVRLARGETPAEWFWHRAVPSWRAASAPQEALRQLAAGIVELEAAPAVMTELILALVAHGVCDVFLAALRRDEGAAMLSAFGVPPSTPDRRHTSGSVPVVDVTPALVRALDRWIAQWGPADERALWLAAVILVASRRAHAANPELVAQAGRLVRARAAAGAAGMRQEVIDDGDLVKAAGPLRAGEGRAGASARLEPEAPAVSPVLRGVQGERTGGAGLLFLLPALTHLGIADLLARHPSLAGVDLPVRLLTAVADRVGVPDDDPIRWALGRPIVDETVMVPFTAPERWQRGICKPGPVTIRELSADPGVHVAFDASGRLPVAMWGDAEPHDLAAFGSLVTDPGPLGRRAPVQWLLDSWVIALRRWCRRYARLGLSDVVRRPGRLLGTSTHLAVVFDHCCVDTRVRRAGLDLDPGWIPWFGRVVTFQYAYERNI